MLLKAATNGALSGTGTIKIESGIVGAILISTDNTNAATVILKRDTVDGKPIFDIDTVTSMWASGPISTEGTKTVYYSITGTLAEAQVYEWIS